MQEQWKTIKGFPDYSVSNLGRVKGCYGLLQPSLNSHGYPQLTLYRNKKKFNKTVHRLIAEAFLPNPEQKPFLNHKDGDKANFQLSNLEWVTPSENSAHAYKTGLCKRTGTIYWLKRGRWRASYMLNRKMFYFYSKDKQQCEKWLEQQLGGDAT